MTVAAVAPARLLLIVAGDPVPWQRARRRGQRYFTDPKVAEYQERIRAAWMVEGRVSFDDMAVVVTRARFVFARKPSHLLKGGMPRKGAPAYPPPDVDNALKGVLDALNGHAYRDDCQVVHFDDVGKRYVDMGEEPHTELEFRPA